MNRFEHLMKCTVVIRFNLLQVTILKKQHFKPAAVAGGICPEGVSVQKGGEIPCEQTDRCKNITFPCGQ